MSTDFSVLHKDRRLAAFDALKLRVDLMGIRAETSSYERKLSGGFFNSFLKQLVQSLSLSENMSLKLPKVYLSPSFEDIPANGGET